MMMVGAIMDHQSSPASAGQSAEAEERDLKSKPVNDSEGSTNRRGSEVRRKSDAEKPRNQFFEDRSDCSKRLFGTLVKRLKMFKKESDMRSDIDKKRRETESRLVEKLNRDKEELLEREKRRKVEEIKRLSAQREENAKMLAESAARYKMQYNQSISNYLVTKESPPIMYKPAVMLPIHKELLEEHKSQIDSSYSDAKPGRPSEPDASNSENKSPQLDQRSPSPEDHRRSVDMELDEEEWLLSKVPEVICDRQPHNCAEQPSEDHNHNADEAPPSY